MEMDGPCAVNRCMTDGKLENVEFFFYFWALVGLLPAGDVYIFDTRSVYLLICPINGTRINSEAEPENPLSYKKRVYYGNNKLFE